MNERFDPRAIWPMSIGAGPTPSDPSGFTVRWRTGARVEPEATAQAGTVIDLRERIDINPNHRLTWERDAGRELLDRIVFRLLGDQATTRSIVDRVIGHASDLDPRRVVADALSQVLEHRGPLGEVRILRIDGVEFGDHRRRLCRELLRWPTAERVGLALRHLGELPLDEIATVLETTSNDVRAISSTWWPDDEDPHGIDVTAKRPLRHLDPIGPPVLA